MNSVLRDTTQKKFAEKACQEEEEGGERMQKTKNPHRPVLRTMRLHNESLT